ncbi:MAG TPA: MMPL family transporter [Candidatus Nanopelagicaceae bacterium]|nr:MMPL family transporter [Candidatus Nanopelagicaceae bacterium]
MNRFFAGLGRFVVRFRGPVVVAWVVVAVVCIHLLPTLASVSKDTNSAFLPSTAPSMRAAQLASPFQNSTLAASTLVAASSSGPLSGAEQAAITQFEAKISQLPKVKLVRDLGTSPNGQARQALIEAAVPAFGGGGGPALVAAIRADFQAASVPGLTYHLTGDLPTVIDSQQSSKQSQNLTQLFSLIFIIGLLLLAFRAVLAPFITLLPAALVLALSGPVVAEATHLGVQVSVITQVILIVLVLGAGTDYGLFLVFRVREELRRGLDPQQAVVTAVSTVGESITFSALTVIAALLSLILAQFGIYQSLGPALAIGIGLMLLAGLTLLPALLAIFGRAVFWPTSTAREEVPRTGIYGSMAGAVVRHPLWIVLTGVMVFGGLAIGSLTSTTAGFANTSAPSGTDSAAGAAVLAKDFPASNVQASAVLFKLPSSAWSDPAVLAAAQQDLERTHQFRSVIGPVGASGLTASQITSLHAQLGAPGLLPPTEPAELTVSPALYNSYRALAQFISQDGHTIQFSALLLNNSDSSPQAIAAVPAVRTAVAQVAGRIGAKDNGLFGVLPFAYDVQSLSTSDLIHIIPLVAVLIALLLAMVMRSLVAPLYLVVSVVLSYLAALGLVAVIFVHLLGQNGINFILPFLMFVFLMALGSDYNILMMTRIREEVQQMPLRQAVRRAVGMTGTTVSTAGLVLGGTFAVLAIAGGGSGGSQIQQIGFGIAAGVFMDTFIIRTLVVPSFVVLLGRWNWWPSRLSHPPPVPAREEGDAA